MTDISKIHDTGAEMPAIAPPPIRPERGIAAVIPNAFDTTGLPKFVLEPETVHAQYRHRGYVVSMGWSLDPDTGKADASMTIFPERAFEDAGAWVITRRGVMRMCDEHNRPTQHCFEQAFEALPVLGYDQIKAELSRLVDVVMAYVDDLVQMPVPSLAVRLKLAGDPMWDVTMHAYQDPSKVLREATI